MPKFQVGDIVTPARDFPAAKIVRGKTYTVVEVGLMGGSNVRLDGVTNTLPHEANLDLVQRVAASHLGSSPLAAPVKNDPLEIAFEPEPEPLSPEQARKERIWAALKGAAKQ